MSKIKNIQIDDFRIYNGRQEFSFSGADSISNLMVIYAPNGYGKTSFFDAVEWCYASKIRRFETDVLGQEINRRDYSSGDKILLTNRQSFKNGKSGAVKISTTDEKIIERTATERKGNNVNYKYDYRTISNLNSDYSQGVLDKLVKTNILTQDQIDEFLRHTKPDERFFQLQNFWPEGENALSILRDVDSYLNMLVLEKNELAANIEDAERKINQFLNAEDQIAPLNTAIKDLIGKSKTGFKIEELTTNVNKETYQVVLTTTQTYIERGKLIEQQTEKQIEILINLFEDLKDYLQWLANVPILADSLEKLSNLAKLYTDLRSYGDSGKILDTNHSSIVNSQQKLTRLLELVNDVDAIYKRILEQQQIVQDCLQGIDKYFNVLKGYRSSAIALQETLTSWHMQRDILDQSLTAWDAELENYRFWISEKDKHSKNLSELKDVLTKKEVEINNKIHRRKLLQSIAEKRNNEILPEADIKEFSKEIKVRNEIVGSILRNKVTIEKLQSDLTKSSSLDETFERLLTWGEEYVKTTDADHCPLCATDFKGVSSLIAKIEEQKTANSATEKLKSYLDDALGAEKDLEEKLAFSNKAINDYIQSELGICESEISDFQTARNKTSNEISSTENAVLHSERTAIKSLSNLQPQLLETNIQQELDFDKIKSGMQLKLSENRLRCLRLENVIKYKTHTISSIENNISILRNKVSTADNTIAILRADHLLVEAEQIMANLELPKDSFYKATLESSLTEIREHLTTSLSEKENNITQIVKIQNLINLFPVQIPELEIPGLRLAKQNEINDNQLKISNYKTLFKSFSDSLDPSEDFFQKELDEIQKYLTSVKREVKELEDLSIHLKVIEKNVSKNSLEEQAKEWSAQVKPLDDALTKVREARNTSEGYINSEVNKYFNQDVINQIYSRIEPHPHLNQIRINPKVTDKGPILDIKAISNDEELDPSLYLSAGQLNVLSLSIFLAKAFETRNGEIDTIFMDDPIQNLSDINILSFIDLIRTMITKYDRQIVISSHDENFYKLMRNKMPSEAFNVRYYEIESFGKARHVQ